jgi:nondiscriminating aspartyl-tRNA synthetase
MKEIKALEKNWWKKTELRNGESFSFRGLVISVKKMKGFAFIHFQTAGQVYQGVSNLESLPKLGRWCELSGIVKACSIKNPIVSEKDLELVIEKFHYLQEESDVPFELGKIELGINNEVLFNLRPYSLRHLKQRAIFKVQSEIVYAFREFFREQGLCEMRTPKIVKEGAEGGANIFALEYFGQKAYLTQSPQFYKEFGVGIFQGVFEVGPVFRAEKHNTSRHINEYTSVDVELGHINSFEEIMSFEFEALRYVFEHLKVECEYELSLFEIELEAPSFIPAISFSEAKSITSQLSEVEEGDLSPSEEAYLSKYALEKWGSEFLFITHYPEQKRPFYTMLSKEQPELTNSFDLLFRGVEVTTGGQRVHEFKMINERLESKGMSAESFEFFTMAHRFGLPPHGGFGLGLERLTQKILGLGNVKEACMYPRDTNRLSP